MAALPSPLLPLIAWGMIAVLGYLFLSKRRLFFRGYPELLVHDTFAVDGKCSFIVVATLGVVRVDT